jgi:hypothetical protein
MQINVEGATEQAQAAAVEHALASALHSENVEFSEYRPNADEAAKAIDPITASFIIGILNTKTVTLAAKALIMAIPTIYSDLKNRNVVFDVQGFKFGFDDWQNDNLSRLREYVESLGKKKAVTTRHALLIGVASSSKDKKIPKLQFVQNDVERVEGALKTSDQDLSFSITSLVNPKHAELRATIHRLLAERNPGDEVMIYYSGHGFKSGEGIFLCCDDTERERLALNGLRTDDIGMFIRETKASQVLIVLDCCYSGGATDDLLSFVNKASGDHCLNLITASSGTQAAKESNAKTMGIFTHYFVDGIITGAAANANREITANSIHSYVARKIRDNERGTQSPKYNVKNGQQDFYFRRDVSSLKESFKEIRDFVLDLNSRSVISIEDVAKVLRNCFGSAEHPTSWQHNFVQNVRAYKEQHISIDEFRKIQGIGIAKKKNWIVFLIIGAAIMLLFFLYEFASSN